MTPTYGLSTASPELEAQHAAVMRKSAAEVLEAAPCASGVAVGLLRNGGTAFSARGRTAYEDGTAVDASTRFELGSLTKPLTALLFAELAARGEAGHHDPLARFLPRSAALPSGADGLTLTHLATHTAGLPRLPPGLRLRSLPHLYTNPYARFTTADVQHALARTRLRALPGSRVRYSNFGVGLLGDALSHAADGIPWSELLTARVLRPLGMNGSDCAPATDTTAGGPAEATGHWYGRPRPPWRIPGLAAAGAARAGVHDLLTLLRALNDPHAVPEVPATLRDALTDVTRPRLALPRSSGRLALIWNIRTRPDGSRVYHHSGATVGFTAFAAFSPEHGTALAALANCGPQPGNHLIQRAYETFLGLAPT